MTRESVSTAIALGQLLKLVEDGVLVRNTKDDGDFNSYLRQSVKLSTVLHDAQDSLRRPE